MAHMLRVEADDGRRFEFPPDLTGTAWLVGPEGGRYSFSAQLLREFLRAWVAGFDDDFCEVSASDGRSFQFHGSLAGTAQLTGPQGGTYEFAAELFRAFLYRWARDSVFRSS
jgi:hypothetical protein